MQLYGIDFSSAPSPRKTITVAAGRLDERGRLFISGIEPLTSLGEFEDWLQTAGPWLAACDFPFGLPRDLLQALNWPHERGWAQMIEHLARMTRPQMVAQFRQFCAARPVGGKFAHRATDLPAGSSPSMKWVNPPVAYMLHAGAPRLLAAGVDLPGLHSGDPTRIALEAYPGLLARSIIGRVSYKSDDRRKQNKEREAGRAAILSALVSGAAHLAPDLASGGAVHGGEMRSAIVQSEIVQNATAQSAAVHRAITCQFGAGVETECLTDGSGDRLDAVLCLAQGAWAWQRRHEHYGFPDDVDPLEGWIVTARTSSP